MNRSDGSLVANVSTDQISTFIDGFILYGIEGSILAISNFLITLVVFVYAELRQQKEYIIVAGLAFANGLQGFAFIVAAIGRIALIKAGNGFVLVSRWQCFLKPWNLTWLVSSPWQDSTLLMVSIDRIVAVTYPLRYFTYTTRYAYMLNLVAYLGALPPIFVGAYISFQYQEPEMMAICFTDAGMDHDYYQFRTLLRFCMTLVSLALYIPILMQLRKTLVRRQINSEAFVAAQLNRLKKVTTTLAISAFFVLLFSTVPDVIEMLNVLTNKLPIYIITNGNEIAYIFIYSLRFKDIRQGLMSLVLFRPLKTNQVQSQGQYNARTN